MWPKSVAWLSLVALTALAQPAQAATVQPKVQLLMRERPSSSARIVDRIPAGKKLKLLGRSADGGWAHVADGRHDGWVPSEQLRGNVRARKATVDESADDQSDEPARPLAKPRHVRPEAWVSKSRYHDGEDNKLTVSATKAELYGRPALGGSVVGILRRGETVSLLRKSEDKKWCLVDIGGGDVAWLQAKSVRPGAAKGAPIPETTIPEEETPRARHENKKMVRHEEPPPERVARPEEPTSNRGDSAADNASSGDECASSGERSGARRRRGAADGGDAGREAGEEVEAPQKGRAGGVARHGGRGRRRGVERTAERPGQRTSASAARAVDYRSAVHLEWLGAPHQLRGVDRRVRDRDWSGYTARSATTSGSGSISAMRSPAARG